MNQPRSSAIDVETIKLTMKFGEFTALDDVSIKIRAGSFHALLGENGAGKSTLVKCIMGFYHATSGDVLVGDKEVKISDPKDAQTLGLGMVYQHFTLVPSLTGAENLVISRADAPAIINWKLEQEFLTDFMESMPFKVPLDQPVSQLAAGEKQKLEILKQLYLGNKFLILDEPTSVLTPSEADEVLGHVRALTQSGQISVLMITHKFSEVSKFADDVTILRRGKHAGSAAVSAVSHDDMARMMMGKEPETEKTTRSSTAGDIVLDLSSVKASDKSGFKEISIDSLQIRAGEIVGIAGISGNGQAELMEILSGQRNIKTGQIKVFGTNYSATREEAQKFKIRVLPEEPLLNACAPGMSVAENLAFRMFDKDSSDRKKFWLGKKKMADNANDMISQFNIKTTSMHSPISALSGGNVQRTVLSRELSGDVELLIVSNPCFGLDFSAIAAIRKRIMKARNNGVAILLISEDLDEILELSDRIIVMSEGSLTFQTTAANANIAEIGQYMAGHQ